MSQKLMSVERRFLARLAHSLTPVVHIGHESITPDVVESARLAVDARELIKVKINPNCDGDRKALAQELADQTGAQVVQVVGKTFVLFKQKDKKSSIEFPTDVLKKAKTQRRKALD